MRQDLEPIFDVDVPERVAVVLVASPHVLKVRTEGLELSRPVTRMRLVSWLGRRVKFTVL